MKPTILSGGILGSPERKTSPILFNLITFLGLTSSDPAAAVELLDTAQIRDLIRVLKKLRELPAQVASKLGDQLRSHGNTSEALACYLHGGIKGDGECF